MPWLTRETWEVCAFFFVWFIWGSYCANFCHLMVCSTWHQVAKRWLLFQFSMMWGPYILVLKLVVVNIKFLLAVLTGVAGNIYFSLQICITWTHTLLIVSQSSGGIRRHYILNAFCQIIFCARIITAHLSFSMPKNKKTIIFSQPSRYILFLMWSTMSHTYKTDRQTRCAADFDKT